MTESIITTLILALAAGVLYAIRLIVGALWARHTTATDRYRQYAHMAGMALMGFYPDATRNGVKTYIEERLLSEFPRLAKHTNLLETVVGEAILAVESATGTFLPDKPSTLSAVQ